MPPARRMKIHWHPFELNPEMPAEAQKPRRATSLTKYRQPNAKHRLKSRARLTNLGKNWGSDSISPMNMRNAATRFNAHQLIQWANSQNLGNALDKLCSRPTIT